VPFFDLPLYDKYTPYLIRAQSKRLLQQCSAEKAKAQNKDA